MMTDPNTLSTVQAQLQSLCNRVLELEQFSSGFRSTSPSWPAAPLSPANWCQERFYASIVADNTDGTYRVRRMKIDGVNQFSIDADEPIELIAGNVREANGYSGMYDIGDIVPVVFDGIDSEQEAIYHIV
jgi:hypothetical protein